MVIKLSAGIGSGPTKLAAFDSALNKAGVANYNLIKLSSVIPPRSKIEYSKAPISSSNESWGDKLYVVMAEKRVNTPNVEAWAGIGWVQDPKTGRGLFVEHEGNSEKTVREDIKESLNALMATRNINYSPIHMRVVGVTCERYPVCALVVAVYQASGWDDKKAGANNEKSK